MEGAAGEDAVGQEQVEGGGEERAVFREEVAGEEIDENPADEPEETGINACHPELFAGEFPREDSQFFDDLRLDGGAQFSLLNGELTLLRGRVGERLVVHAARLERREELPRGMEVQRQVGEIVETDGDGRDEEDDESQSVETAKEGARGIVHEISPPILTD